MSDVLEPTNVTRNIHVSAAFSEQSHLVRTELAKQAQHCQWVIATRRPAVCLPCTALPVATLVLPHLCPRHVHLLCAL